MIQKARTYITEGNTFFALEILEFEGQLFFHLLEIKRHKGVLFIQKEHSFEQIEMIVDYIKSNTPLVLTMNTKSVLTKIGVSKSKNLNPDALVDANFPNLNLDHFYYEVSKLKQNQLISIIKKEHLNSYLDQLKKLKINVVHISLGASLLQVLVVYLKSNEVYTSTYKLLFKEASVERILQTKQEFDTDRHYEINGIQITNRSILNFAHILGYISKSNLSVSSFEQYKLALQNEFKNERMFKFGIQTAIGTFLFALLLNFLIYNHYFQQVQNLQSTLALDGSNKEHLKQLALGVQKKEERVASIHATSNSKVSFYLDRIAKELPESILLEEIQYHPLKKTIRPLKPIETDKNVVTMLGYSNDANAFTAWIEQLEQKPWLSKVETLDYDFEKKDSSKFRLKLELNEQ